MKVIYFLFLLILVQTATGQKTYKTSSGNIDFNASTPLEDIKATNSQVNAILKLENGGFASVLLMKEFNFRRKLMQEHFNENYVESATYPKAYLSGTIENLPAGGPSSEEKKYLLSGKLTIHGVTRNIDTDIYLSRKDNKIYLRSDFIVKPEDFGIEVPKLLFKKIAQEVKVNVDFKLKEESS